jgi:hypothetical protein
MLVSILVLGLQVISIYMFKHIVDMLEDQDDVIKDLEIILFNADYRKRFHVISAFYIMLSTFFCILISFYPMVIFLYLQSLVLVISFSLFSSDMKDILEMIIKNKIVN